MKIMYKAAYSEDRARDFYRYHLLIRSRSKYIYYGLSTLALVVGAIAFSLTDVIFGVILIFTSSIILIIRPIQAQSIIKKTLEKYPHKNSEFSIVFTKEEISFQLELIQKKYSWDTILDVVETNYYWFIYVQKNAALLISKYQMDTKERMELRRWMIEKFHPSKYKNYAKK